MTAMGAPQKKSLKTPRNRSGQPPRRGVSDRPRLYTDPRIKLKNAAKGRMRATLVAILLLHSTAAGIGAGAGAGAVAGAGAGAGAGAAAASPRLLLACQPANDLLTHLPPSLNASRFASPAAAVGAARSGDTVLALADGYPSERQYCPQRCSRR